MLQELKKPLIEPGFQERRTGWGGKDPGAVAPSLSFSPEERNELYHRTETQNKEDLSEKKKMFQRQASTQTKQPDRVQFASKVFYVHENYGKAILPVIRIGHQHGTSTCKFKTRNKSGKAGHRYVGTMGEVIFKDGEFEKDVVVPLIASSEWCSNVEFEVELRNPHNCELGKYLYKCRVKVLWAVLLTCGWVSG